jgi:hypothetical protein
MDLVYTYVLLTISSLFLFTHLIFVPVFSMVLGLQKFGMKDNKKFRYRDFIIPICFGLLLLGLIWVPINTLSNNAEFAWGTGSFYHSLENIIRDSFYNNYFLGKYTFRILVPSVIIVCAIVAFNVLFRQKSDRLKIIIFLFIIFILGLFGAHLLIGFQFPINRKGLIYLPFLCFIIPGIFEGKKHLVIKQCLGLLLILSTLSLFFYNYNLKKVHEWYYDYNTKEFTNAIIADAANTPATLATHWLFHWTAKYYLQTTNKKHQISLIPYSKNLDTLQIYDYYLVEEKHLNSMDSAYRPLTDYDNYKNVVITSR